MTYEIVKVLGSQKDKEITLESTLIKLGDPIICRQTKTYELYETDYVIVEALQITDGEVVYGETHVVASDEEGRVHDAVLYLGTKALTVHEAMFSVGEHNYDPSIEQTEPVEADKEEDTTND